jgi:uncharacterized protein (UPF0210 family)
MSGAFIPVSEDAGMIEAAQVGALELDKLEAWTSVCSVGIDMVAVPGSTSAETIAAIIADEMAIGVMNNKTTAVRIIPVPGTRPSATWLSLAACSAVRRSWRSIAFRPISLFAAAAGFRRRTLIA